MRFSISLLIMCFIIDLHLCSDNFIFNLLKKNLEKCSEVKQCNINNSPDNNFQLKIENCFNIIACNQTCYEDFLIYSSCAEKCGCDNIDNIKTDEFPWDCHYKCETSITSENTIKLINCIYEGCNPWQIYYIILYLIIISIFLISIFFVILLVLFMIKRCKKNKNSHLSLIELETEKSI